VSNIERCRQTVSKVRLRLKKSMVAMRLRVRRRRQRSLQEPPGSEQKVRRRAKSLDAIEREHLQVEWMIQEEPFSGEQLDRLRAFMRDVALAGLVTRDSAHRDRLRAILRQWGTWVRDKTGKYPPFTLEPWQGPGWFERAWPWARRGLVVLGFLIVAFLIYNFGPQISRSLFPIVTQSDVLIVVARFDESASSQGSDIVGEALAKEVAGRLRNTLADQLDGIHVWRIQNVITDTVVDDSLARVWAAAPVTLVVGGAIEGDTDGPTVTPVFHLTSGEVEKLLLFYEVEYPSTARVQPVNQLPYDITNGAAFIVGQLYLAEQRYQPALTAFSIAIQEAQGQADDGDQPLVGLEEASLKRAETYGVLEAWDKAISDCTAVINLDRNLVAQAYLQRARIYAAQDRENKDNQNLAIQDLASAIEREVDDLASAYYNRGLVYYRQQNYESAIADANEAVERNYDPLSFAHYHRGLYYHKQADGQTARQVALDGYRQALQDYDQALKEDFPRLDILHFKRGLVYNELGQYAEAESDLRIALDEGYSDVREVYYYLGFALASQGDHAQAIEAFSAVVVGETATSHPLWTSALYRRGLSHFALGQYNEAARDFSLLLAEDETHIDARFQRALALYYLGQNRDAVSDLTATLEQDPTRLQAYYWRGRAYAAQDDYSRAIEDLTVAIENDVYRSEAHYYRGLVAYEIKDDAAFYDLSVAAEADPELGVQAIATFGEVIARDPASPMVGLAYTARGYVYLALGDEQSLLLARADFDAAADLQSDGWEAEVYHGRGLTNFALEDYRAAAQDFGVALEKASYPWLEDYYWRGRAYLELLEWELAIEDFTFFLEDDIFQQQPLQADRRHVEVYLLRGDAYLSRRDYELAEADFDAVILLAAEASDKANAYLGRGKALFHRGEYEQAQASLKAAAELDEAQYEVAIAYFGELVTSYAQAPQSAPAHFMRAYLTYERSLDTDGALDDLNRSISADPTFVHSYLLRGQIYEAQDKDRQAIADYSAVIKIDPTLADAYFRRGQVYAKIGDHLPAIADYTVTLANNYQQPAPVHHKRGVSYYERQDYSLALADFDAALTLDANLAESHLYRGLIYLQRKLYGQAAESLAIAIRLEPTLSQIALDELDRVIHSSSRPDVVARAYYMRGRVHLFRGGENCLQRALDDLTEAIRRDEHFADAYFWRGQVHFQQESYSRAIADFGTALERDDTMVAAYYHRALARFQLTDYRGTLSDLTLSIRLEPNQADRAIAYFKTLIEAGPKDPTAAAAYYIRGRLYQLRGDEEGDLLALQDFNTAIRCDPAFKWACYDRGLLYMRLDAYPQAVADFTEAIHLEYDVARAYYYRGLAQVPQGAPEAAIADLTAALEQDASLTDALYRRGLLYHDTGQYGLAIDDYATYLKLVPGSTQAYFQRGLAYISRDQEGDRQQAVENFSEALKLNPDWPEAFFRRGLAHLALSNQPSAEADFTAALELDPSLSEAFYRRGLIRLNDGEEAKDPEVRQARLLQAVDDFAQVIAMRPQFADAYYNRAKAHRALGQRETALADFETYLERVPNAPDRVQVEKWIAELR